MGCLTGVCFINQEALGKSTHDVQMVLDYLAGRGDFDMSNVKVFGVGAGGTIAVLAASADSRIKAIDLLDPWGTGRSGCGDQT